MKSKIEKSVVEAWIDRFHHRAEVMREIQSGIAERNRVADRRHTLAVVLVGAFLTFIAFSGTERVSDAGVRLLNQLGTLTGLWKVAASTPCTASAQGISGQLTWFEFFFNLSALALFVLSIVNLIYRWKEEHQALFEGVKRLTQYMHWLDEIRLRIDSDVDTWILKEIRLKYQIIVDQLPPSNEKDYLAAKDRLKNKVKPNGAAP